MLNIVFSVIDYLKLHIVIFIYCISYILPTNVLYILHNILQLFLHSDRMWEMSREYSMEFYQSDRTFVMDLNSVMFYKFLNDIGNFPEVLNIQLVRV